MTAQPLKRPSSARKALHSKGSPEWHTPAEVVEAARELMGGIDLDPASSAAAQVAVRAERYLTADDDGLNHRWVGDRVLLNPPGGLVRPFWERLCANWADGTIDQAIWIGYSLEQLQVLQSSEVSPLDFPLCFPRKRLAFVAPAGGKNSPTHGNYVAYLPPRDPAAVRRFAAAFRVFGKVVRV